MGTITPVMDRKMEQLDLEIEHLALEQQQALRGFLVSVSWEPLTLLQHAISKKKGPDENDKKRYDWPWITFTTAILGVWGLQYQRLQHELNQRDSEATQKEHQINQVLWLVLRN